MAQQTINVGAAPNDGTGTPLRTAFQYTNSNFSELYTALGGGSGLPGATTQVIFNDGGTNLAGDAGLVYNKTTDALTIGGNVQAASATITGDLTVDTSTLKVDSTNNRVGIGTASPATRFVVSGGRTGLFSGDAFSLALAQTSGQANYLYLGTDASGTLLVSESNGNSVMTLSQSGVCNWLDGAGGTRMTLNATGLGVGVAPTTDCKLTVRGGSIFDRGASGGSSQLLLSLGASSGGNFGQISNTGTRWALGFGSTLTTVGTEALIWDSSGNLGLGVTPSAWTSYKAIQVGPIGSLSSVSGATLLGNNMYYGGGALRYIASEAATMYGQEGSVHKWYTAASDTAGLPIAFTQAMTLDASGNLLVGVTSANANGGVLQLKSGITFPATQVASSDANTLDDYEEGTWTPVVGDASSSGNQATTATAVGRYTKIGRLVTVQWEVTDINTTGLTAGNAVYIRGLPFASSSATTQFGTTAVTGVTFSGYLSPGIFNGSSFPIYSLSSGGSLVDIKVSALASGTADIWGTLTYIV
jgi:hypothetical protein